MPTKLSNGKSGVALRFPPHSTNAVLSPQAKVVVADRCKNDGIAS